MLRRFFVSSSFEPKISLWRSSIQDESSPTFLFLRGREAFWYDGYASLSPWPSAGVNLFFFRPWFLLECLLRLWESSVDSEWWKWKFLRTSMRPVWRGMTEGVMSGSSVFEVSDNRDKVVLAGSRAVISGKTMGRLKEGYIAKEINKSE